MVDQTTNHDFDRPTVGGDTDAWGSHLNDTIDALEEKVIVRDTEANRTNYTAYVDALFIATDTGAVYQGDGTSWQRMSTGTVTKTIDDTDSPYLTADEDVIYADTSGGAVTITLASADATLANQIRIINLDGSNDVTLETEGSETFGDGSASKSISTAGWSVGVTWSGGAWQTSLDGEFESVNTGAVDTGRAWQQESSIRALNTEYTNNSDSEIKAAVVTSASADATRINITATVSGVSNTDKFDQVVASGQVGTVQFMSIPAGSTYTVDAFGDTADYSISSWLEFKQPDD